MSQTQPSTQQVLDPRRLGRNNSGLSDVDVTDVIAIMHPATPSAIKIVENAADRCPQHVLFRNALSPDSMNVTFTDIEEQETIIINDHGERLGQNSRTGADLALRISSGPTLRYKSHGFIFGRNPNSSDIVFGQDSGKRISNQHFRVYLNLDGILMIEDLSTNGTIVDDVLLKGKDNRFPKVRMMSSGSIVCIQGHNETEMTKFVVRVPSRGPHKERFDQKLRDFIADCAEGEDKISVKQRIGNNLGGGSTMKWDGGAKYNIVGIVGKGAFATVHQLATKMEGKLLAAKELEKRRFMKNGQLDKKIDNEMRIMQSLRHPNIVEFVEYHDQGDYLYIIMEYVRHGDLQTYLHNNGPMSEKLVRTMAQQVLNALAHLHRLHITHRDIKPDNILIADVLPLRVKLSDFGLSKVVKHEETFLKTFCGTLLYCAPEVFPDYGESRGTKRRRNAAHYHQYSSSVDIWSFGGVLWYALCGEPPFRGIADATGQAMYNNITTTPLDTAPLERAGVSTLCIDLLTHMLLIDPSERPDARACLSHPWLEDGTAIPPDPALQSIAEEEEEVAEQQLSQLNIRGEVEENEIPESDDEVDVDEELLALAGGSRLKRVRKDPLYPRNQVRDHDAESSGDASFQSEHIVDEDESFNVMPTPRGARLFGEIGQSALQSSGILSNHAQEALSQPNVTESDYHDSAFFFSHTVSGAEREIPFSAPPHLDGGISSPSLLGTESLVREMNMTSPASPASGVFSPNEPATPRTPEVPQHNSLERSGKFASQISEPTPKARPSASNRHIVVPVTASHYYDPLNPDTHNLEYASRVSGFDFIGAQKETAEGVSAYEDTTKGSEASTSFASDSATGEVKAPSPSAEVPSVPAELDIRPPPRRLGKLVATKDSFAPGLVLNIDKSKTSWGRLANNTIVYEQSRDTRVPKTAFIIFWYSSGGDSAETVQELSQKNKDWTSLEKLNVGIWTCATHGISINGKHLKQKDERGRVLFGHLHTGDIIQVYQDSRGTECLKFRCEFYLGSGKDSRAANQSFQVLRQ